MNFLTREFYLFLIYIYAIKVKMKSVILLGRLHPFCSFGNECQGHKFCLWGTRAASILYLLAPAKPGCVLWSSQCCSSFMGRGFPPTIPFQEWLYMERWDGIIAVEFMSTHSANPGEGVWGMCLWQRMKKELILDWNLILSFPKRSKSWGEISSVCEYQNH